MACGEKSNPLQRSGTSRPQRELPGLDPEYVRIDERRYSDWIAFAAEFSRWLKFHDPSVGLANGDWQDFFTRDVSAVLGSVAVQDIGAFRLGLKQRLDFLRDDSHAADEAGLRRNLGEAFSGALTLAKALNDYAPRLDQDTPFKATLGNRIQSRLGPAFLKLLSYYKAAEDLGLYAPAASPHWKILGRPLTDARAILALQDPFSDAWWMSQPGVTKLSEVAADASVFGQGGVFARSNHAANHFLFTSLFDQFTETYTRLIAEAETGLTATLEDWDGHQPHYALFLAFLKLFRTAQAKLNEIPWRHLDHYYRDILRLRPRAAVPDHVHLIAELAKTTAAAALPAGTLFKAGKDSAGKDVTYALDQETAFTKAEVASFKAVYKGDAGGKDSWIDADGAVDNAGRLFAAPMMDSADGLGAELKMAVPAWHPFANKTAGLTGKTQAINMPPAQIGFAVASHYLFLAEGKRMIRIRLDGNHVPDLVAAKLACHLTTEKKWLETAPDWITQSTFSDGTACTEIRIALKGTDPAITAFSAKIHGGAYAADVPVVKFILGNVPGGVRYGYDVLKELAVTRLEVQVEVGTQTGYHQDGSKNLAMSNPNGTIDASKPFQAWGSAPVMDTPLVIGSKELFSKGNAAFNLHIEWANRPAAVSPSPEAKLQFLEGGTWKDAPADFGGHPVCFAAAQRTFAADVGVDRDAQVDYADAYAPYNPASKAGFMRVVLKGGFGQEAYLNDYSVYLMNQALSASNSAAASGAAAGASGPAAPIKPYLPMIHSLYLSYAAHTGRIDLTATDAAAVANRPARFFHVGPFGESEQQSALTGSGTVFLLPRFRASTGLENAGEWYIGIKNLLPDQSVNLLFQVLEGSTDPLLNKPEKHVEWSYLSGDQWRFFPDRQFSDGTRQLVQSGIIAFAIPSDATVAHGLLPAGHIWLRAAVTEAVAAVCKILSVQAQAMRATFLPNGNAADFLDHPLPAGTISKPKETDARFKKFAQPFPSFGGKQTESDRGFYLRSSERLRHKGRAITIWDYEHLVLEAFPQLYRAKCLNHTRIQDDPDASLAVYNENQPGYVTLIAIPSLVNRNEINPLKPYASQGLLSGIKDFLKGRVTGQLLPGQVNVNVCNPLFEEISLEFSLSLAAGFLDFTYYSGLLAEEITRYLSPWAFAPGSGGGQGDIAFGGRVVKSALINFIEERPYVDFITDVVLNQKPENKALIGNLEEAVGTTSRSILVSAPATSHLIHPYAAKP